MLLSQGFLLQDRYRIEMLLGRGGMGAVYKATDMRLGHTVAIKQNLFETAEGTAQLSHPTRPDDTVARRAQFEREARLLASLKHSGLAKVTDYFFVTGEGQYLVMDFIDGQDFGAVVQQLGALREEHAAGFIIEIAQVLEYLHAQSPPVIHRDIKPANIRVTPQGQVFLVDFGVAKVGTGEKTMFGAQAVTPGFSPLEQFGGDKPTDQRADIYSLAATLYALTIGKPPPSAIDILRGKIPFDSGTGDGLRPTLVQIVQRGMALEPEDRYQSMAQFREALIAAFPERTQKSQSTATVNLVTQIYTQPMNSPGSEMGVLGMTGSPDTGVPSAAAPPTTGNPTTGSRLGPAAPPDATQRTPAATVPQQPTAPHQPTARPQAPPPPMPQPPSAMRQPSAPVSEPMVAPRAKGPSPVILAVVLTGVAVVAIVLGRDQIMNLFGGKRPPAPVEVVDKSTKDPIRPAPVDPPPTVGAGGAGSNPETIPNAAKGAGSPANDVVVRPIEKPVVQPPTSPQPTPTTPRDNPPATPPAPLGPPAGGNGAGSPESRRSCRPAD